MNPSFAPLDSLLVTIVLATLAVGLPILVVLAIRFLWDRNLKVGRSKELEKLIWQLHRIASALEHQMNLSFPAVQPGTEEPRDVAYLQRVEAQPAPAASAAIAAAKAPGTKFAAESVSSASATQQEAAPKLEPLPASAEAPRRAGVNSMFDL